MSTDNRALWELVEKWRELSTMRDCASLETLQILESCADELAAILERPVVVVSDEDVMLLRRFVDEHDALMIEWDTAKAALESMVRGKS